MVVLSLRGQARAQSHVEIRGRGDRFKAGDQIEKTRSLIAKIATSAAGLNVRQRYLAQGLVQFRLIDLSPRVAAFSTIHD